MGSCRKGLYKCRKACCRPKASQMMALLPSSAPALKSVEAAPPSAVQNLPSSSRHELPTRLEAPAGSCRRTAVQRPPASPQARCPRDRRRCCMPNSRPSERTPKGRPKNSAKSQPASRHPQQEGVSGAASAVRSPSRGTVRRAAAGPAEPSRAEQPGSLRPEAGGRRGAARPGTQAIAPSRGAASRPTGARRHATERAAEQSRGANPRPAPTACRCRAPTVVQPTSWSKDTFFCFFVLLFFPLRAPLLHCSVPLWRDAEWPR